MQQFNFFATCPKNLEELLEHELIELGASNTKKTVAGVNFSGDLTLAYRVCLWSRLANRILLPLAKIPSPNAQALYGNIKRIPWLEHFTPEQTFVVDFAGQSPAITNTHFGAQKAKDAIVDHMREKTGNRPSVDKDLPDIRINVYLHREIASVSLDLSGESLHRRGYRQHTGVAPLKENLAAAILMRAKWPEFAKNSYPLIDPLCGSGTILIEAAMLAADIAPGLLRWSFGFQKWVQHQSDLWQSLWNEAEERRETGLKKLPPIYGFDADPYIINIAQGNIKQAELTDHINISVCNLVDLKKPTELLSSSGLIVTNPPYGERIGKIEELKSLYKELGEKLKKEFPGWQAAVLTANAELAQEMRLRADKHYAFFNGAIPCKLMLYTLRS
jgi:23S rRNA (guanine2445-N2)-methyltransferase / 23S rRNA (guanine2069-N7)-methyltransferase